MGLLHADQPARDSLALDLMEAVRPEVDADVLALLTAHTFTARDFFETREGVCRVLPPLTQTIAAYAPRWRASVAPVAERAARMLGEALAPSPGSALSTGSLTRPAGSTGRALRMPTILTGAARSAGRDALRRRPTQNALPPAPPAARGCVSCGVVLPAGGRRYCDGCRPERHAETLAALMHAGPAALARLHAAHAGPSQRPAGKQAFGARIAARNREAAAWDAKHPDHPDPEAFQRETLPRLSGVPLSALMRATGLSRRYCSLIRRGLYVPHPRHWEALARAGRSG